MNLQAPKPGTTATPASLRTTRKVIGLLIFAGLAAYANSFNKPFHMDDNYWIANSESIKNLRDYLAAMPTRFVAAATFQFNYRVHGVNVFGYHLVNVAIHIAAALTLLGIVRRTLLLPVWQGRFATAAPWLAFAVALFWMVHPLQTQAVTYVIQRLESMMGLCFLLTIYCTVRGVQSNRPRRWYATAWLSCLVGAGSKEVMVAVLPILIAYDYVFVARWNEMVRRRGLLYAAIAAIWIIPVLIALSTRSSVIPELAAFGNPGVPVRYYWMTQAWVLLYYLSLCIFPYPQVFSYRSWPFTTGFADCVPAGLVLALMLLVITWLLKRRHWLGFLGLWFFGILSTTSIIPLADVAFEHRLYLPLAAISVLVVFAGFRLLTEIPQKTPRAVLGSVLTFSLGILLTGLTVRRNEDYTSTVRLVASIARMYKNDYSVLNSLGEGYEAIEQLDQARDCYEKSLEINKNRNFVGAFNYGRLLCRRDDLEGFKLQSYCLEIVRYNAHYQEWIAQAHYELGSGHCILGQWDDAEHSMRKALELSPKKAKYHAGLGLVLNELSRADDARACYLRALELQDDWPRIARDLARHFVHRYPKPSQWTRKEALFYARQAAQSDQAAQRLDPSTIDVLVESSAANGHFEQAVAWAEKISRTPAETIDSEWRDQLNRTIAFYRNSANKTE